jgi:hypothetical protein
MLARVRRLLNDAGESAWDDDAVLDALESASAVVSEDLVISVAGRRCLRVYGEETEFTKDETEYELPGDCLLVDGIEWRECEEEDWQEIERRDPQSVWTVRSGNAALMVTPGVSWPGGLYWCDDVAEGMVRMWPAFGDENEDRVFRIRYFGYLAWPSDEDGTFNDPEGSGTDSKRLPPGIVEAVEYYAAAVLALEEMEDGKPMGAMGSMYQAAMRRLARGSGRGFFGSQAQYIRGRRG